MGNLSELKGVEKPVTEWLTKMGWSFKSNEDLKVHNRTFSNPAGADLESVSIPNCTLFS
jgi:type I restriction enzyme R subunit